MITVRKKEDGSFERISGNPVLLSLDGERKAPLRVILHPSWTAEDRAEFGIYQAEPAIIPEGKVRDGGEAFEMQGGKLVQIASVKDAPVSKVVKRVTNDELKAEIEALAQRVAALEARKA